MKAVLILLVGMLTMNARGMIAQAYNQFGFKLLKELARENPEKNIFISPASLAFALSMAANGANGDTSREMCAALGVSRDDLISANKDLLDKLAAVDPGVKLEIANAIWVDSKAAIKPAYLAANQDAFHAMIANADFQSPATVGAINLWVRGATHDKIHDIVSPPLNPLDRMILLNAVYFKGEWMSKFDKTLTRDKSFTTGGGASIMAPRMAKTGKMRYGENPFCQAVALPYGGHAATMIVFLPAGKLSSLIDAAPSMEPLFDLRNGTLELPRFKMENSYELIPALKAVGITKAFGPQADFSGMSDEPLAISDVKQKTYVDVNEEGTEAAAVTSVGMRSLAVRVEQPPFRMIVDRPFLVEITDAQTGLILFLGAIQDPR